MVGLFLVVFKDTSYITHLLKLCSSGIGSNGAKLNQGEKKRREKSKQRKLYLNVTSNTAVKHPMDVGGSEWERVNRCKCSEIV